MINVQKSAEGDYQAKVTDSSGSVTSVVAHVAVVVADIPLLTNDLVAHYRFEHNLIDSTGRGNDGTAGGNPGYTPSGRTGGAALDFSTTPDGSQVNYVTLGVSDDLAFGVTNDFSVVFWLRYSNPNGEFPLLANRDWSNNNNPGWGIAAGGNGQLKWTLVGAPGSAKSYEGSGGMLSDGAWHHVALVFQRSANATTYFDGAVVDVQSLAGSGNDISTPSGLNLNVGQDGTGAFTGGGNSGISANLDDLGIWQRALSPDEASLIYAKGVRGVDIELPVFNLSGAQATRVTGQWDFDQGDLRASVGQALEYGDTNMVTQTSFGSTTSFGIPDIGGQVAKVLKYTRTENPPDNYVAGYAMHHGISPNGGGTLVNRWTLIADMLIPDLHQGDAYTAVIEIQNDPNSDADISIHEESPGVGGIGISGQYPGNITAGQWHRIVVAVDMADPTPVISKFVDGAKAADQTSAVGIGLDGRFALSDVAHLFSDGEHDNEVNTYYVNSVQIRDGKLSDDEVAALGGPQAAGIPLPNEVTGQWDFDQGDLRASVGQALQYGDSNMVAQTSFGTTTSFGISDVNGQVANVMKYARNETPPDNYVAGYAMHHGISPNGGGTLVNRWTLIADMLIPDFHQGDAYTAVIEIQNDPNSDADISIHEESPGIAGIGISGQYPGNITAGQWHRIAVAVDMAGATPVISKFVDGAKVADQTSAVGIGLDGRFALSDVAHLFSDGEHDNEVNTFYVNSVQIRNGKLSDEEVASLGGPQAAGIPLPNQVTGQWDFDQGDLRASVGQDLEYGDAVMPAQTSFGTTTSFGISDVGGQPAKVMKYTRNEAPPDNYVAGYIMHHGIAPNGGGSLVNRWTLIADMLIPDFHQGDAYTAVIEIQNDPNSDADISIHEESPGVAGIGISGQYPGNITAGQWHRIVVAVDMAAAVPLFSKFVDGAKVADQTSASGIGLDGRFALHDVAHLFSDGEHDNEVNTYYVNSVQIRAGKLSDDDVAALGGPQAAGIPLAIPPTSAVPGGNQPKLTIARSQGGVTISWDATITGYVLESTPSLTNPSWTAVPGVTGSAVTLPATTGSGYYRLKQ
jgi:peptide methionine sulfoxide reductase MsrB